MKRIMVRIVTSSLLYCGLVSATSEFRTPLSVLRGPHRYPLKHVSNSWWYDQTCDADVSEEGNLYCATDGKDRRKDSPWYFNIWKSAFYREAHEAFICKKEDCDDKCGTTSSTSSSCDTDCDPCSDFHPFRPQLKTDNCCQRDNSRLGSLSTLWFGKERFTGQEAFAGGQLSGDQTNGNPFLIFSNLTPQFDYKEWGIAMGAHIERRLGQDNRWRVGSRLSVPFKVIEIEHHVQCGGDGLEEGISNVIAECPFNVDANGDANGVDSAYRLDFLTSLVRPGINPLVDTPLVEYGTGAAPNQTKVAGIPVGFDAPFTADNPPVFLIKSVDGSLPEKSNAGGADVPNKQTFGKTAQGPVSTLPANGAGADNALFYFDATADYNAGVGADVAAQGTLFVVPRIQTNIEPAGTGNVTQLNSNAVAIRNAVRELIADLELSGANSAAAFFKECCIDLCKHERTVGIGDLDWEIYGGYGTEDNRWFINGILGFRFPTGRDQKDARRLYRQPTGNNGHYEIKLAAEGGWNPCRWFAFFADLNYNHVFEATQEKAAPFTSATIRNIGPCVKADVSWDYFTLHADLNFLHPRNHDLGCLIGYEFYHKRKDNVELCSKTAIDCLKNTNDLNNCILEACTDTQSHKIRGELFHRWSFCELFAGASHVVGGRNVMQETEIHLGAVIHF